MPYTVKIDHPNAGDSDLYIHGLGTFHNGEEATVSDDQWFRYRAGHAIVNTEIGTDGLVKYDPQLGPDLDDLNLPDWITITKADEETQNDEGEKPNGDLDPTLQEQMVADEQEAGDQPVIEAPVTVVPPEETGTAKGGSS
jgi:hypothetical protein